MFQFGPIAHPLNADEGFKTSGRDRMRRFRTVTAIAAKWAARKEHTTLRDGKVQPAYLTVYVVAAMSSD